METDILYNFNRQSGVTGSKRTGAGSRIYGVAFCLLMELNLAVASFQYLYFNRQRELLGTKNGSGASLAKNVISDGTKLLLVVSGYIYTSTDKGVTWTARTWSGNQSWNDIVSSSDGTKL